MQSTVLVFPLYFIPGNRLHSRSILLWSIEVYSHLPVLVVAGLVRVPRVDGLRCGLSARAFAASAAVLGAGPPVHSATSARVKTESRRSHESARETKAASTYLSTASADFPLAGGWSSPMGPCRSRTGPGPCPGGGPTCRLVLSFRATSRSSACRINRLVRRPLAWFTHGKSNLSTAAGTETIDLLYAFHYSHRELFNAK